jgi:hypothetical protein
MLLYKEDHDDSDDLVKHHRISLLMNIFLANIIIIFIIGTLTYGEKFNFRDYAYSYLGMIKTPGGNENTLSFIIYVAGCILNSIICFKVGSVATGRLFKTFFIICGVGYLLLMLPCDMINSIHSAGGALVVGSLWLFSILSISDIYHFGKKLRALAYFILLNGTILPYAFMHFTGSPSEQIAQKPALLGLIVVLKMILMEYTHEDVRERMQEG